MYLKNILKKRLCSKRGWQSPLYLYQPEPCCKKNDRYLSDYLSLNTFMLFIILVFLIIASPRPAENLMLTAAGQSENTSSPKIKIEKMVIIPRAETSNTSVSHKMIQKQSLMPDIIPVIQRYSIGVSNDNHPIQTLVLGDGEEVILIIASMHGDETAGTPLVWRLAGYLYNHPALLQGRKVMLLPMVNPDGDRRNSRYNSRGVDLNRNFSASNRINTRRHGLHPLSEPETRAVVRAIRECNPDRIVAIHQPLACIDYDGPAKDLAVHMAKYCDLPVRKLGAMPGSLGSYAGLTLGIPIITLELTRNSHRLSSEYLWKKYGFALIACILYPDPPDSVDKTDFLTFSE